MIVTFQGLKMTNNLPHPEFQDDQNSIDNPSDETLQEAQGGSFGSALVDAVMLPVRPLKNLVELATGDLDKKVDVMEKTGQNSTGDALLWTFFPNSMEEKTEQGIDESIQKRSEDQARLNDQLG